VDSKELDSANPDVTLLKKTTLTESQMLAKMKTIGREMITSEK